MSDTKPTGTCDICKTKPAEYWYGNTAAAICGDDICTVSMNERYEEHCAEMDRQFQFEKEMREMYGEDY